MVKILQFTNSEAWEQMRKQKLKWLGQRKVIQEYPRVVTKKVAAKEIESGKLIALSLSSTPLYRTFYMIHHREKHISGPLKQFMNLIKQA